MAPGRSRSGVPFRPGFIRRVRWQPSFASAGGAVLGALRPSGTSRAMLWVSSWSHRPERWGHCFPVAWSTLVFLVILPELLLQCCCLLLRAFYVAAVGVAWSAGGLTLAGASVQFCVAKRATWVAHIRAAAVAGAVFCPQPGLHILVFPFFRGASQDRLLRRSGCFGFRLCPVPPSGVRGG